MIARALPQLALVSCAVVVDVGGTPWMRPIQRPPRWQSRWLSGSRGGGGGEGVKGVRGIEGKRGEQKEGKGQRE